MSDPVVHVEVNGSDSAALKRFYAGLFGWPVSDIANGYGLVPAPREGGVTAGIGDGNGQGASVRFYVGVADTDAALQRIESAGGKTLMPTTHLPGAGVTMALFSDPAGNTLGLLKNP